MENVHTESSEQTSVSTATDSAAPASSPTEAEPAAPANDPTHERKLLRETARALYEGLEIAFGAAKDLLVYLHIEPSEQAAADETEPPTDRTPPKLGADIQPGDPELIAPLAVRTDGVALLHAKWLPKAERKGRKLWKGIVLTNLETSFVKDHLNSAAHEAASRLIPHMKPKR